MKSFLEHLAFIQEEAKKKRLLSSSDHAKINEAKTWGKDLDAVWFKDVDDGFIVRLSNKKTGEILDFGPRGGQKEPWEDGQERIRQIEKKLGPIKEYKGKK